MAIRSLFRVMVSGLAIVLLAGCQAQPQGISSPPPSPIADAAEELPAPAETAELNLATPSREPGEDWLDHCPGAPSAWVSSLDLLPVPEMGEPLPRRPFRDAVFHTCVVRVSDRAADLDAGDASTGIKNYYSRVQAFNADESRILLYGLDGSWYLYDARTLDKMRQLPLDADPRWSETDPNVIYFMTGTMMASCDIRSGEVSTVHDFSSDLPGQSVSAVWTRYEGSPSADGRFWGLMAEDEDWLTSAFLVYDLQEDRLVSSMDVRGWPAEAREIDSVSISLNGDYFLAYLDAYCEPGQLGSVENPCGLMVFDRNLQNGRGLLRIVGHSDLALDENGQDVLVFGDIDADTISVLNLGSGSVAALWPVDFTHCDGCGMHFSGRGFRRPGWALISAYDGDPASYTWMDDQVFAIELKPGGRVVRLAHHHSLVDPDIEHDYWAEPHASANRDLTRILFTSNWGQSGSGIVETYMIALPERWGY